MQEKNSLCRRTERWSGGSRRPFLLPGSAPRYAPDRPVKLEHLFLNAMVDPHAKIFSATVTQTLRVVAPQVRHLKLDQVDLAIDSVKINKKTVPFSIEGQFLIVSLVNSESNAASARPPVPGETLELTIQYRVPSPRRGLYFTGPDAEYPNKPYQVWTQGQDEDTRYWIPTLDYPNQKTTTEVIATVPKGFVAVSNGALLSKKEVRLEDGKDAIRYHYKLATPHVTYLITLAVAEFSELTDSGPEGLPIQYYVRPGRETDGKRAFQRTPQMIEAFVKKTGIVFPYEKYSQVAVQDFIFGGMENTSATTQTDRTLHDERAHLDFSSDPLVAHELAHQWFGDLITCRDWSHGWLNEGFATFMERVWVESNLEEYGTPEAATEEGKYYSYSDLKEYLEEDAKKYRRPIVCNTYIEPIDLFDAHLYQKGGLVLNLIRAQLGEDLFWKSINHYLTLHRGQNVETLDLVRAIEETTGRNLRRFFDEWIFGAGHPEFELSYQWHEDKKLAEIVIEQKQTEGKPEFVNDGIKISLFHLPVKLELTFEDGKKLCHSIEIGEPRDRVFLPAESKPLMVRFDPGNTIPKSLKFPRPKEMLIYQLENDPDCMGRIEAAKELAKIADLKSIEALAKAVQTDSFWGVQAEAAEALGEIRMDAARDALVLGLKIKNPKARRAVVKALGSFSGEKSAQALKPLAQKDPSYFVEAEATTAWTEAQLRGGHTPSEKTVFEIEEFLISQLSKESHLDVIRGAALKGLAELPGIGQNERPRALQTLMDWTRRGKPEETRVAAIGALGAVMKSAAPAVRFNILKLFSALSDENTFKIRMRLVTALGQSELLQALPILESIHTLEVDGRIKSDSQRVISALVGGGTMPESLSSLKVLIEKMQEDQRKLRNKVEELETQTSV